MDKDKLDRIVADARQTSEVRSLNYRELALSLFPHVCARCGRVFEAGNLQELTVHHRDHNHDNNPVDGSNWELLCIYCHDNEHQRLLEAAATGGDAGTRNPSATATFRPFADIRLPQDSDKSDKET